MTVNEDLRNRATAHQIYLLRYQARIVREITELLKQTEKDLLQQLNVVTTEWQANRLEQQLAGVRTIISESYRLAANQLQTDLNDLAVYEASHEEQILRQSVPIDLAYIMPAAETLIAAVKAKPFEGKLLSEWMDKLSVDAYTRIRDAVRMGVVEGETYHQITKRVMGTKALNYSDGVTALNFRQAQALVATAVSHTANESRQTFYEANEKSIKGVQWVSTLDARTTPVCQSRDGKVYPVDSGPRPPAHIRCRSTTVPVLKSWKELGLPERDIPPGTRASMDGQVAETETYQSWLKKKSPAFQDDVLGPARGKLFREGMPLDRFVDQSGHEYALKQLKTKDAAAFKKAGIDV